MGEAVPNVHCSCDCVEKLVANWSILYSVSFSMQVPIEWESVDVTPVRGPDGKFGIPQAAIESVNKNKVGLKGPLMTPVGKGHRSLNLALRK